MREMVELVLLQVFLDLVLLTLEVAVVVVLVAPLAQAVLVVAVLVLHQIQQLRLEPSIQAVVEEVEVFQVVLMGLRAQAAPELLLLNTLMPTQFLTLVVV
jgi:hypothetical protein